MLTQLSVQCKKHSATLASAEGRNAAHLSRTLVTIQTNCDYPPVRCELTLFDALTYAL